MSVEEIKSDDGVIIAIIVRSSFREKGVNFISKPEFSLQLGVSSYDKGKIVKAHMHIEKELNITTTQEVVIIKSGSVRVDLYDVKCEKFNSVLLSEGDTILFADGGHGLEMLDDTEIIEVKQGPYSGIEGDKRFLE